MQDSHLIMRVLEVPPLAVLRQLPPILLIAAQGEVPNGGYTNARLDPWHYLTPPADGIYAFNFVADPPTGPSLQVISPVHGQFQWVDFPPEVKGVRIHGQFNHVERHLEQVDSEWAINRSNEIVSGGDLAEGHSAGSEGGVGNGLASTGGNSFGSGGTQLESDSSAEGIGTHGGSRAAGSRSHELQSDSPGSSVGT